MNLRPATPADMDAFVRRHRIGIRVQMIDNRLVLNCEDHRQVDSGSWETGAWWPRLKALAPTSWYVDEMIDQEHWREEVVPAQVTGLSRDLPVLRARRKSDWSVSEWHGDRTTFCPPLYDDRAIGSGACGLCRACFLILTHRIRRDPWRHLLYDNVDEFWSQAAAWLRGEGRYAYTRKACTQRTLGLGIDRSDSLLFEGITGHARTLAPLFASERSNPDGRQLIFLTKSTNTHYLAGLPAANVVVSMSLNPQAVADCWENVWPDGERVTRPIGERVQALVAAQEMGFVVRLRLDPILPIPGWQDLYQQFLAEATAALGDAAAGMAAAGHGPGWHTRAVACRAASNDLSGGGHGGEGCLAGCGGFSVQRDPRRALGGWDDGEPVQLPGNVSAIGSVAPQSRGSFSKVLNCRQLHDPPTEFAAPVSSAW